jgi:hypothetical protein
MVNIFLGHESYARLKQRVQIQRHSLRHTAPASHERKIFDKACFSLRTSTPKASQALVKLNAQSMTFLIGMN